MLKFQPAKPNMLIAIPSLDSLLLDLVKSTNPNKALQINEIKSRGICIILQNCNMYYR